MGKNVGLEELKSALQDSRLWLAVGVVKKTAVLSDLSAMRVQVSIWPEEREIIATMTWEATGPDSGIFEIPEAGDLVMVAMAEGDADQAFVIRRMTSKTDPMPAKAKDGHMVLQAKKELHLKGSKVAIGKKNSDPTEPLVLGNVLKTGLGALLDAVLNSAQIGVSAMGPVMLDPSIRAAWTQWKADYLNTPSTNIVSQVGFTERGN